MLLACTQIGNAQEPHKVRHNPQSSLCLESHKNGRMGSSPKPYFTHYNNGTTPKTKRLSKYAGVLP